MSRSIAEIQQSIIDAKNAQADLAGLTSNSHRAIWLLWTFVVATCIAFLEQLMDLYLSTIESLVAKSAGASALWVQDKLFKFQYDVSNPQIAVLINTVPQYAVVDATKRIITACSVTTDVNNTVRIKVAQQNPYVALDASMIAAAQSYISTIGVAGIDYKLTSLDADRLYIKAQVYFKGQYAAVMRASIKTAISNYLQTLSQTNFNGNLKMSDLENVIRDVQGVNDVVMIDVIGRPNSPTPADPTANSYSTVLIQGQTLQQRLFNPLAGYIVPEDVATYTLDDSGVLILIPE